MLRIQDGRLPLHYAAEKGATLAKAVVELLLGPESNAATATAPDKARLPLCHCHTPGTSLFPLQLRLIAHPKHVRTT